MKRNLTRRKQRLYIALAILAFFLAVVLISSSVFAIRERERLEALRLEESLKADQAAASGTTTGAPTAPQHHTLGGYRLLAGGNTDFHLYYFGDETIYGRGMSDTLSSASECFRSILKEMLLEEYGTEFKGRVPATANHLAPPLEGDGSPPLWVGDVDFDYYNQLSSTNFRLAILAPSGRTAAAGEGGHPSTGFTGDFAHDLEETVRNMRRRAANCDILLVVPHDADAAVAEPILAIAAYYDLRAVDMRTLSAELLDDDGFPNEDGHRAYAEAIFAEILCAAEDGHTTDEYPKTRLYN